MDPLMCNHEVWEHAKEDFEEGKCISCGHVASRAEILKHRLGKRPDPMDPVNHPKHYTHGQYEAIDVIEDWGLSYHEGNALKYICRAKFKGNYVEDLKKAVWYLQRAIDTADGV